MGDVMADDTARIGVIGAAGWLGSAIVTSLLEAPMCGPDHLTLSFRRKRPDAFKECRWTDDNQHLVDRSQVIILSVRPDDWAGLEFHAAGKLVISVMAGVRIGDLEKKHGTARIVRAVPNAAASVGKSYTPWIASPAVDANDRATVRELLATFGTEDEVSNEDDIDYLTSLSGSGPAFPALLANAMMKDALAYGLPEGLAQRAVNSVLIGSGRLLEAHDARPSDVVTTFLKYRGTTAAAIEAMCTSGFDRTVATGLRAALQKSVKLGGTT
jgi:pyrroline-5-carboxylate reductase